MWLTLGVSALLGALSLLFTREFSCAGLTPEDRLAALGQVLATTSLAYNLLRGN